MFNDKKLKSVAEEVSKIMSESLKGNQHKIDVAEPKGKLTSTDFKKLRTMKKEETEQIDEVKLADLPKRTVKGKSYGADYEDPEGRDDADDKPAQPEKRGRGRPKGTFKRRYNTKVYKEQFSHLIDSYKTGGLKSIMEEMQIVEIDEDTDNIEEMAIASVKNKQGKKVEWNSVGGNHMVHVDGKPAHSGFLDHKSAAKLYNSVKEEVDDETYTNVDEATKIPDSHKAAMIKVYGPGRVSASNGMIHHSANGEKNSHVYEPKIRQPIGRHVSTITVEEVDNETFTKEVQSQKEKDSGKGKKADVAAASVQAVRNEEVESVDERTLTEPEMNKREKVVKSMKKNLAGFKERYGSRAKDVMYATATKVAKGEK